MKIKENEPLSKYTTFKMGGIAKKMYFPETEEELLTLVKENEGVLQHIIGGGSNLLINDEKVFGEVLCLKSFNTRFDNYQNGEYYIGASVRLQKVINTIHEDGYGGIEYLYSVPGLIGGAIYMNAGRGKKYNECISDYIQSVDVLIDGKRETLPKGDCGFSHRTSKLQTIPGCVVIGAYFQFPVMSKEESAKRIQERIELCKKVQDMSAPNFGTVFCEANKYIMALVKVLHFGYVDGCIFSGQTANWMLHNKRGTFVQALRLINRVKKWHKIFRQNCKVEVKMWE